MAMNANVIRSRVLPLAAFLALAAVSAAVAQTVDGLDLGAIKARGSEQIKDAQVFVDAVAGRGDAHQAEAEELRTSGLRAVSRINPADLPKGEGGPIDFDELLVGAAANASAPMGEGPLFMVFASLSMPPPSLTRLIRDTTKAGGIVVFRGFPQNSTRAFADGLKQVVTEQNQEAHIAIDPRLFRAFKIEAAPTFVVTGRAYDLCDGLDCSSAVPDHDRMVGNVTAEYVLESFAAGRGPGAGVAAVALANLRKGA